MNVLRKICVAFATLLLSFGTAQAQNSKGFDVFVPISKYLAQGDAESLSAWFSENMEVSVISNGGNCSRAQAKHLLKSFFENYSPRSFEIIHTTGRAKMKYALGNLSAGGESFIVRIFVCSENDRFLIQELKIERR